ncbi:signal peptidase I [Fusobacterium pseudoperiodonticum]|uniref:Signal peptidase I n=1 Tax=Fusobacterium pseudoperiodonticum TaxID=2663009 RepID=A0AAD0F446_9FUSO|nr:signal peptidase I [Fusobacterium pseudoperiodonticum]ATV57671.1 signal peptidase I [Fusobacterium pseudoperiodonticum]ATV66296.1 signal peptidase I [Fusobacterium pseudoperiodonticum]
MKTILYGIFYFFLTLFFAYIFIKEKDLAKKFDVHREKFVNKIVKNEKKVKSFKKFLYYVETIGSALILVVVIQRFYIGNFKIPTGSMIPTIEIGDRVFADMVSYKFTEPKRNSIIIFDEPMRDEDFYTKRAMGLPGETIKIQDGSLYINGEKTDFRRYSNNGIGDQEWRIPKKGDKLEIIPAGKYRDILENAGINVDAVVEEAFYKEPFEFFKNLYYGLKHKIFDKLKIKYDINEYVNHRNDYRKQGSLTIVEMIMPNLKFVVNGEETGPILDFISDKEIRNKLLNGETVEIILEDNYYLALGDNTDNSSDSRYWGFVKGSRIRGRALVRFWPLNRIGLVK